MEFLLKVPLLLVFAIGAPAHAWDPEIGKVPGPIGPLEYVDGTPLDIWAPLGKPLVIYIGADWCGPCVQLVRPAAAKVANKYAPMGLEVVFVSMDDNRFCDQKLEESKNAGLRIAVPKMGVCAPGNFLNGLRDLGAFG